MALLPLNIAPLLLAAPPAPLPLSPPFSPPYCFLVLHEHGMYLRQGRGAWERGEGGRVSVFVSLLRPPCLSCRRARARTCA